MFALIPSASRWLTWKTARDEWRVFTSRSVCGAVTPTANERAEIDAEDWTASSKATREGTL